MYVHFDTFVWSPQLPLAHWGVPFCTAVVYLLLCLAHNASLGARHKGKEAPTAPSNLFIMASAVHNIVLIAISLILATGTLREFVRWRPSLSAVMEFLCPPPLPSPQPLDGAVFAWTYLAYLSKYYELLDTAFIIMRRRRVIPLHMFHHAFMPIVVWLMFYGEQMQSLCGVAVVNSTVHVVMYSYYLVTVIRPDLMLPRLKRAVTELQLVQFLFGLLGNLYFFTQYFEDLRWSESGLRYKANCRGSLGIALIGLVMNVVLTVMFSQFYVKTYMKASAKTH